MDEATVHFSPPGAPLHDGVASLRPVDDRDRWAFRAADRVADIVDAFGSSPGNEVAFHQQRWRESTAAAFAICPGTAPSVECVLMRAEPQGRADIGYGILPAARGHGGCGLAARATHLAAVWALTSMGVARVQLWAAATNIASARRGSSGLPPRRCPALFYTGPPR